MISRAAAASVLLALVVAVATGCQPEPEPSPTAPAFATEETYRAYVDALNQVDLSDPETFEAVYEWTTGDANAEARATLSEMHADGWSVSGASIPAVVEPRSLGGSRLSEVNVAVCLDVSGVQLVDANGQSVVTADRPDLQSMLVSMEASPSTETGWAIEAFQGRDGEPRCT